MFLLLARITIIMYDFLPVLIYRFQVFFGFFYLAFLIIKKKKNSNCCCRCTFEPEIIKIGQSSHKMYRNNIVNFQESTTILNACTKKSGNLLNAPHNCTQSIWLSPCQALTPELILFVDFGHWETIKINNFCLITFPSEQYFQRFPFLTEKITIYIFMLFYFQQKIKKVSSIHFLVMYWGYSSKIHLH